VGLAHPQHHGQHHALAVSRIPRSADVFVLAHALAMGPDALEAVIARELGFLERG
jgi:hypothetical protein